MTNVKPEPLVLSRREGAVLTLTLNRPDKSNSLHPDLVKQLSAALKAAKADNTLSVAVITGAGHTFCAGLDLELLVSWTTEQKLAYLDFRVGGARLVRGPDTRWLSTTPAFRLSNYSLLAPLFVSASR